VPRRRRRPILPEAESALDRFKHEVARELGLEDDIQRRGWENMTTREVGKIGGNMVRRMIRYAEEKMREEQQRSSESSPEEPPKQR